jgi:hypothetical protein
MQRTGWHHDQVQLLPADCSEQRCLRGHRMPALIETVIYHGTNTHYILRMPHCTLLTRQHDERGGPVVGLTHCASVTTSWNMARNQQVRDDA